MNESKPWFVKITGPMQWQLRPYAWQGWAMMVVWGVLMVGIMALLILESVRERWWIVTALTAAITIPLILFAAQNSVPIEVLRAAEQRRRNRGRPPKRG